MREGIRVREGGREKESQRERGVEGRGRREGGEGGK